MRAADRVLDYLGWFLLAAIGFTIVAASLFVTAWLGVMLGIVVALFAAVMFLVRMRT